jgi:hypothetical protein
MLRINIQINVFSITPSLEKHFFLNKKVVGNVRESNDFMDHNKYIAQYRWSVMTVEAEKHFLLVCPNTISLEIIYYYKCSY